MNLDRREKHVLNELKETYHVSEVSHLVGALNSKKIVAKYHEENDMVLCMLSDFYSENIFTGVASCSPKDIFRYAIGRMIAFANAAVNYVNFNYGKNYSLSSHELESLVLGRAEDEDLENHM